MTDANTEGRLAPPPLVDHVRAALRRRWRMATAIFAVIMVAGAAVAFLQPVSYTTSGVIAFEPRPNEFNGRDLVALLASRYPAVVSSSAAVGTAATAAGLTTDEVRAGLTTDIPAQTLNLGITVKSSTPEAAQAAAQSLFLSVQKANESDPYLQTVQVDPPPPATQVAGVSPALLLAVVAVLGALVAVMAVVVVDMMVAT